MCRIIFLAFFTIAQILPSFAADNSHLSSDPRVQTARTLIKNGRYAEALPLLRRLAPNHPDQTDVLFLLGLVSIRVAKNTESTDDKNALLDEAIAALPQNKPQLVFARQLSDTNYQLDIYKSNSWQLNFQQQF